MCNANEPNYNGVIIALWPIYLHCSTFICILAHLHYTPSMGKITVPMHFYGQTLNEITIASNGALLTGSKSAEIDLPNHIAPFLSNLPPSEDDSIIYTNDGMKNFFLKFHCIVIYENIIVFNFHFL